MSEGRCEVRSGWPCSTRGGSCEREGARLRALGFVETVTRGVSRGGCPGELSELVELEQLSEELPREEHLGGREPGRSSELSEEL